MQKLAEEAVITAFRHKVKCDFSVESLEKVDQLIDLLSKSHRSGGIDEADMLAECLFWGAYIGEVIRKHHNGGEWSEGLDGTGHATYPLAVAGKTLYPCRWCVERVRNGVSESVWKNYQAFALEEALKNIDFKINTNKPAGSH
jgi:hypothetical protein